MSPADLADLIAALPPLVFAPAAEAPVSLHPCLVAPKDAEWLIAHRDQKGWATMAGEFIDEPLLFAVLPPPPGRTSPRMIADLARFIVDLLDNEHYGLAAQQIDELADAVRAVRDKPPG